MAVMVGCSTQGSRERRSAGAKRSVGGSSILGGQEALCLLSDARLDALGVDRVRHVRSNLVAMLTRVLGDLRRDVSEAQARTELPFESFERRGGDPLEALAPVEAKTEIFG